MFSLRSSLLLYTVSSKTRDLGSYNDRVDSRNNHGSNHGNRDRRNLGNYDRDSPGGIRSEYTRSMCEVSDLYRDRKFKVPRVI